VMIRAGYLRVVRSVNNKLRFAHCTYQALLFALDELSSDSLSSLPVDCYFWAVSHYLYESLGLLLEGLNALGSSELVIVLLVMQISLTQENRTTGAVSAFGITCLVVSCLSILGGLVFKIVVACKRGEDVFLPAEESSSDEDEDEKHHEKGSHHGSATKSTSSLDSSNHNNNKSKSQLTLHSPALAPSSSPNHHNNKSFSAAPPPPKSPIMVNGKSKAKLAQPKPGGSATTPLHSPAQKKMTPNIVTFAEHETNEDHAESMTNGHKSNSGSKHDVSGTSVDVLPLLPPPIMSNSNAAAAASDEEKPPEHL
jgi:hypothetical protein